VRDYDPALALDGGADGLDAYRVLIPQLSRLLTKTGAVMFETGQGQAETVATLLHQAGYQSIVTYCDLGGIERCVLGLYSQL
jgi:release factor glutamine methyltransferase